MIHLPSHDNEGVPLWDEIGQTIEELKSAARGLTGIPRLRSTRYEGIWEAKTDVGIIVFIDVFKRQERKMSQLLRERLPAWRQRFRQLADIYIAAWDIEIIE